MDQLLEWLRAETQEPDDAVLNRCLQVAYSAIQSRRYPYDDEWPEEVEPRYKDLQYRIALDLYNKRGAEGELSHSENGVSRGYESSWISESLLQEVVPFAGVLG